LHSLQAVIPIFLAFGSSSLFADQVGFKNGDRLTGTILKSGAKSLLIRTAVAGEITVQWQEIQEIRSDLPLHIELSDGKILVGRVTSRDGRLEIVSNAGISVEAPKESVKALRNNEEQLAYEKIQHPSLLQGWNGGIDAGLELTRGNSETRNFRFAFRAARRVSRDKLTLYAESTNDLPNARPHVTANETRGGVRFDRDLTSRVFVFGNADFMSDGLQDLNLRSVLGGGVGFHLVKSDRATLNLLGGANFTRENYTEVQRNLAAGQFGEEFALKFWGNTSLNQYIAFFPNLTDSGSGNHRISFSLGTLTKIVKWLGWQNNFSDVYVTNPPAGKKQNEFVFTSGLNVAFAH
jgi:putative salt-induced outer membrane protein